MEKIVKIATQWPKLVFAVLLLISAGAVLQLDKLTVDTSASVLMLADDPDKAFYQTLQETFGSDNTAIVYVEDKALFSRKKLQLLQSVTTQLAAIEGVEKVTSLFTLENVQTADTRLQAPLLIESIPETDAALESLRRTALNSPFARNILSSDGTATALYIHFRHALVGTAIDAHLVEAIEQAIAPLIREVVTFAPDDNTFERAFQIGAPYQRHLLATTLSSDLTLFIVLTLVVVLLCLGVYLKSPGSLLVLVVTAALSGLWSLACMALLKLPVTLLTALLPVLLIALGSLPGIRLLDHYRSSLREGQTPQAALWSMVDKLSPAFFLTFACSWLAVLSLRLNDILVLQQFATAASLALLFSFIITLILLPLYLSTFGHRLTPQPVSGHTAEPDPDRVTGSGLFGRAADALIQAMPTNKMTVPLLAIVLAVVLGAGMVAIKSNNDPADFLSRSALLQSRNHLVTERLHGMQTFTIVFSSEQDGAFKDPALLNEIQKVQDFIQQLKLFDTSLAVTDLLSHLQREAGGGDMPYYGFSGTAGPAPNYLPALWDSTAIKPFVSADYKQAIVRVWHHYTTSQDLQQALTGLQAYTDSLDKRLEVRFSGADILLAAAADSLLNGQVKSLAALMLAMFVLISLLFLKFKAGLIALLPNLAALAILFGVMGYLAIPFTVLTAPITVISLAIGLGYTLRLMLRQNEEIRTSAQDKQDIKRTLRTEITPILTSATLLILGFGVLLVADLKPMAQSGGLAVLILLTMLLANVYITPLLLSSMRFVTLWGMVTVNVSREIIDNCDLFKNMHTWQIKQIILLSQVQHIKAGTVFIQQGEVGHEMYVILAGTARVETVSTDGSRQLIITLHEGQVIGEVALVSQAERTADVVAETDLQVLVLEWKALERLGSFLPMISARLFLNIANIIGKRLADELSQQR